MKPGTSKQLWFYVLILLVTIAANSPILFFYKGMYLDDMGRYTLGLEGRLHPLLAREYPLGAYIMDIAHRLMVTSLSAARLYIATLLVLSNITLFYIFNRLLKFPILLSFVAAIFPAILPGQTMVPGFIAGSYTVPGSLLIFISILFAYKFLEERNAAWGYLSIFSVAYTSSLFVMLNGLFYFLPLALIFLSFNGLKLNKRITYLLVIIILADLLKILLHLFSSSSLTSQTPANLGATEVYIRVARSLTYLFPIDTISGLIMTCIFIVLIFWGAINLAISLLGDIKAKNSIFPKLTTESLPLWLGIAWVISGGIVFWFKSPFFDDRYFHMVSYGSGLLTAFFILNTGLPKNFQNYKKYGAIALITLVALMIFNKIEWQIKYVDTQNSIYTLYKNELVKIDYPRDSQIIVAGNKLLSTGGYWFYSSGYLKYLTGRPDIAGVISYPELQFYNPFNTAERGFNTHMTGIDLERPVYLFREIGGNFHQIKYALYWEQSSWENGQLAMLNAASAERFTQSPWRIYAFNPITGAHTILGSGKGLDGYRLFINGLSRMGIMENDILWAGPIRGDTYNRFESNKY